MAAISVNQEDLIKRVAALEDARASLAFAGANATTPSRTPAASADNFDGDPIPNVLRVRFDEKKGKCLVPMSPVQNAVTDLLDEKGWSHDTTTFDGNGVAKSFSITFSSKLPSDIGGKQADEVRRLLKPNGKWRIIFCNDASGNPTQIFFNKDTSPKANKTRASCRMLLGTARSNAEHLSEKKFFQNL